MNRKKIFDFNSEIGPHGEDSIRYEYMHGDFHLNIFYNDNEDAIKLVFTGCSYQYFSPVPGYYPETLYSSMGGSSGCLYEIPSSFLLKEVESISEQAGYRLNQRHFFIHLEDQNVSFHILADDVEYKT